MKRLYKILMILILSTIIITNIIYADDYPIVTYDQNTKEITSTDKIYTVFDDVLPGDKLTQTIKFKLKNIKELTKLYLSIDNKSLDVPEDIKLYVYLDNKLILDGINSSVSDNLICQTTKDTEMKFDIIIDVPNTIGNEIKKIDKENIWSFVIEDGIDRYEVVDTGVYVSENKNNNQIIFILLILSLSISLIYNKKKSN